MVKQVVKATPKPERYIGLDLMRFVAALMVVAYHYTYRAAQADKLYTWLQVPEVVPVTRYGEFGVQLFFMISGFVIAWSMHGRTPWQFLRARILRLVPAFVVAVVLTATVTYMWGAPQFSVNVPQIMSNLTFFAQPMGFEHVDGVYWTLQIEWQFYAAVAFFLAVGLLPRYDMVFMALWLAAAFIALTTHIMHGLTTILAAKFAPWFCIGMLVYRFRTHGISKVGIGIFAAAVWMACLVTDAHNDWELATLSSAPPKVMVLALVPVWITMFVMAVYIRKWPAPNLLVMLGGLTYPLYLLHARMGYIFFNHMEGWPRGVLIAMALLMALLAAWVMNKYLEPIGRNVLSRLLPK